MTDKLHLYDDLMIIGTAHLKPNYYVYLQSLKTALKSKENSVLTMEIVIFHVVCHFKTAQRSYLDT